MPNSKYSSVDDLQAETTLPDAAAKCGLTIDVHEGDNPFNVDMEP